MTGHPLGPLAEHHAQTQALVDTIRKRTAREMVRDLKECSTADSCTSVLHHRDCPVHP